MPESYFALLGLPEGETNPARIEAAYKQRKRLWDQRRHNPAYQHQWALRQEELARAFETLRRPEKRARYLKELRSARHQSDPAIEEDFRAVCELAMSSGFLPEKTRRALLERATRQGLPLVRARRLLEETMLELGVQRGRPAGIRNYQLKLETFRFFVAAALADGVLTENSREMLENLAREFGFSDSRLDRQVDELLLLRPEPEAEGIWQRAARTIGLLVRADQQSREMAWLLAEPIEGRSS